MSYRFSRITNYYPQYLDAFCNASKGLSKMSYDEAYAALINDSYESASSYSRELNKLEGVTAMDIISNADFLQDKWKKEHLISNDLSSKEVILLQLKTFRPDVIWVDDFNLVNDQWMNRLKKEVPSIRLVLGHICAPYGSDIEEKFRYFDVVFSCIPCMVDELKEKGIQSFLLYHSFDQEILKRITRESNDFPTTPFLFSGSLYSGAGFHNKRLDYIEAFLKNGLPISIYANLESSSKIRKKKLFRGLLVTLKSIGLGSIINLIPLLKNKSAYANSPVRAYSKKLLVNSHLPVFGISLFKLIQKADITFNNHGEIAGKCAGNIRMFEVTGVGSCLLSDWKDNITDLFEPGKEIITYTDIDDCLNKVVWLLNNPEERKRIAKAGQARTIKDHTVAKRVEYLNGIIKYQLEQKS